MNDAIVVRTQDDIVARREEASVRDPLGFEADEYLCCLDFEHLRPFLRHDLSADDLAKTKADWEPSTLNEIDQRAKAYLPFWLEKIEDERGLSVCRATAHFTAWKWLLGHEDADTFPGSVLGGDGGWYQRRAYEYIQLQIVTGEWDRLTEKAIAKVAELRGQR